jgi:hypothetical protein
MWEGVIESGTGRQRHHAAAGTFSAEVVWFISGSCLSPGFTLAVSGLFSEMRFLFLGMDAIRSLTVA